ncbi:hypothetical protein [Herbaspirillum sp.]|uniref:hypothetical protein n=1 Tax=Herbaspirillum sp. TaxID=1890675 RepID=UPI0031E30157
MISPFGWGAGTRHRRDRRLSVPAHGSNIGLHGGIVDAFESLKIAQKSQAMEKTWMP